MQDLNLNLLRHQIKINWHRRSCECMVRIFPTCFKMSYWGLKVPCFPPLLSGLNTFKNTKFKTGLFLRLDAPNKPKGEEFFSVQVSTKSSVVLP